MYKSFHIFILLCLGQFVNAQNFSVFKQQQLFMGVTAGINYSFARATESYSVLMPTSNSASTAFEKKYDKLFQNNGNQVGIHLLYGINKYISIVAEPSLLTSRFAYVSSYSWTDTVESMDFSRELHHTQKLSYFTLPVMARWDFTISQFSPFVQVGGFADFRSKGFKSVRYDNAIDGEVAEDETNLSSEMVMTQHLNKSNFGLIGGIGITYFTKHIIFGFESNFRYGFKPLINDQIRFSDLTGFTTQHLDVLDQVKWGTWSFQFSAKLPIFNMQKLTILRQRRY
jgi:hypothetical protein